MDITVSFAFSGWKALWTFFDPRDCRSEAYAMIDSFSTDAIRRWTYRPTIKLFDTSSLARKLGILSVWESWVAWARRIVQGPLQLHRFFSDRVVRLEKAGQQMIKAFLFSRPVVRQGFLLVTLTISLCLGSTLWAIVSLPYLPGQFPESFSSPLPSLFLARSQVPAELSWFFVQFHYLSPRLQIRSKNHHRFVVTDARRHREYVVTLGQQFRRVEIYYADAKGRCQIHVFTPGAKRVVWLQGTTVTSDTVQPDGNDWMWRTPLWNSLHLKIYALADVWQDAPYKRFSCAGFAHQFLNEVGIHVPKVDAWDFAKQPWVQVSPEELEPGDIITIRAGSDTHRRFWRHKITHVGVYLGQGKIIHAATASPKARRAYVRIADLDRFSRRIDKILRPPQLL